MYVVTTGVDYFGQAYQKVDILSVMEVSKTLNISQTFNTNEKQKIYRLKLSILI